MVAKGYFLKYVSLLCTRQPPDSHISFYFIIKKNPKTKKMSVGKIVKLVVCNSVFMSNEVSFTTKEKVGFGR